MAEPIFGALVRYRVPSAPYAEPRIPRLNVAWDIVDPLTAIATPPPGGAPDERRKVDPVGDIWLVRPHAFPFHAR